MSKSAISRILVTIFVVLSNWSPPVRGVIRFKDGGYSNIMVAISERIPEDEAIVRNIQMLFTNASRILHRATKGQARFQEVTIIAPSTWQLAGVQFRNISGGNLFSDSDVRIDPANPLHGDTPYTLQPGECGESGKYIHLTPAFVKNLDAELPGSAARQLVHEWAHFRYGVFEEYGDQADTTSPAFYLRDGKVRPVACVRGISGWVASSKDGGRCTITDGAVRPDCRFYPDVTNRTTHASLMSYAYLPAVDQFCNASNHNLEAPSRHNVMCDYRSTWDVIASHEDFKHVTKWPDAAPQDDKNEPTFTWKRIGEQEARYVLVLDVSSSMSSENRIGMLKDSATRFVKDRVPIGSHVGIVTFTGSASRVSNLVKIVSDESRQQLANLIAGLVANGNTDIGKGLMEGIKTLSESPQGTEGAMIILVSDGEGPIAESEFSAVEDSKVIINTIAFGKQASQQLERLVTMTGGESFFFDTSKGNTAPPTEVDAAFLASVTSQANVHVQPINIATERMYLTGSERVKYFTVDREVGRNMVVTVVSTSVSQLTLQLVDPQGKTFGQNTPGYDKDVRTNRILVKVVDAEPGRWKLILQNGAPSNPMNVDFSVTCEAKNPSEEPIRVHSWVSAPTVDLRTSWRRRFLRIYAEVKKGYRAVLDATVIATVHLPNGLAKDVTLRDNGAGADVKRNDGIYSAYFAMFHENGRYTVFAKVANDGRARLRLGSSGSPAPAIPPKEVIKVLARHPPASEFDVSMFRIGERNPDNALDEMFDTQPVETFERSASAGAFKVDGWTKEMNDKIPPNRVTDLTVVATNMSEYELFAVLQWTSPGEDMDIGNASKIELRGATNVSELSPATFEKAFAFNNIPDLDNPLPSGELQVSLIRVPLHVVTEQNGTAATEDEIIVDFYFALRAHDALGNMADISNIARAHFSHKWDKPTVEEKPQPPDTWNFTWLWIAVSILIVFALMIGVALCCDRKNDYVRFV